MGILSLKILRLRITNFKAENSKYHHSFPKGPRRGKAPAEMSPIYRLKNGVGGTAGQSKNKEKGLLRSLFTVICNHEVIHSVSIGFTFIGRCSAKPLHTCAYWSSSSWWTSDIECSIDVPMWRRQHQKMYRHQSQWGIVWCTKIWFIHSSIFIWSTSTIYWSSWISLWYNKNCTRSILGIT